MQYWEAMAWSRSRGWSDGAKGPPVPEPEQPGPMPGSRPPRWECLGIPVRTQYVLLAEKSVLPEVAPYLKIKFPTADSGRGLGTGEFDETVGVDLSKTLFPRFVSYVTLAYTFIGSPAGTSFDNSFGWSVGAAYLVAQPFSVFAFLDGSTAISPGQANPLQD